MHEILRKIGLYGLVPVVKIDRTEDAIPLAEALCEGGLPVAEITFRTSCAAEAIRSITQSFPEMLIGAGTVLTCQQADQAAAAGAKFVVSPGLNPKVVEHCLSKGIPVTPGCSSPSDVEQALEYGLDVVKFFPAEAAGGLPMIQAMSAPYPNISFLPTGGIHEKNLLSYLQNEKVLACGGSYMVKAGDLREGNFSRITQLTRGAVSAMLGLEWDHVGIPCADELGAREEAGKLSAAFGLPEREEPAAHYAGSLFECMKPSLLGEKGHLAIRTNFLERAVFYLESRGVHFLEETKQYDEKGRLCAVSLREDLLGLAVHLVQKV